MRAYPQNSNLASPNLLARWLQNKDLGDFHSVFHREWKKFGRLKCCFKVL